MSAGGPGGKPGGGVSRQPPEPPPDPELIKAQKAVAELEPTVVDLVDPNFRWPEEWSELRTLIATGLSTWAFDAAVSAVIVLNLVFAIFEADAWAAGGASLGLRIVGRLPLCIFAVELVLKFYVLRFEFFLSFTNKVDVFAIAADLLLQVLPVFGVDSVVSLSILRVFRLSRLARVFSFLDQNRELYLLSICFRSIVSASIWAGVFLGCVLCLASVVAVHVLHPLNLELAKQGTYASCERCEYAFGTVWESFLTLLQQMVMGDDWKMVAIPLMEVYPWTAAFLLPVFCVVGIGCVNLIIAVVVDRAYHARIVDDKRRHLEKYADFEKMKKRLLRLFSLMDVDESGTLDREEILQGFDTMPDFREAILQLDLTKDDLNTLFNILDCDGGGDIDPLEFVAQMHKVKTQDSHILIIFLKHYVVEMQAVLSQTSKKVDMQHEVIMNMPQMIEKALKKHAAPPTRKQPAPAPANSPKKSIANCEANSDSTAASRTESPADFIFDAPPPLSPKPTPKVRKGSKTPPLSPKSAVSGRPSVQKRSEFRESAPESPEIPEALSRLSEDFAALLENAARKSDEQLAVQAQHLQTMAKLCASLRDSGPSKDAYPPSAPGSPTPVLPRHSGGSGPWAGVDISGVVVASTLPQLRSAGAWTSTGGMPPRPTFTHAEPDQLGEPAHGTQSGLRSL